LKNETKEKAKCVKSNTKHAHVPFNLSNEWQGKVSNQCRQKKHKKNTNVRQKKPDSGGRQAGVRGKWEFVCFCIKRGSLRRGGSKENNRTTEKWFESWPHAERKKRKKTGVAVWGGAPTPLGNGRNSGVTGRMVIVGVKKKMRLKRVLWGKRSD